METQQIKARIESIRKEYGKQRAVFIPGADMEEIVLGLGALPEDLDHLRQVSNHLAEDPTLPFRMSKNGRFLIDFEKQAISRLAFQPFVLSPEEDFVRHDSGMARRFRGIQDDLQLNTVFQKLMVFQSLMLKVYFLRRGCGFHIPICDAESASPE